MLSVVARVLVAAVAAAVVAIAAAPAQEPPIGCGAQGTEALVRSFVRAYNRADFARVDRTWAHEGFQWYSATQARPKVHHVVYERAKLLHYLKGRHFRGERWQLTSFRFNGWGGASHFQYVLTRRATDLRRGVPSRYVGKGAATCPFAPPQLIVWSMGGPH